MTPGRAMSGRAMSGETMSGATMSGATMSGLHLLGAESGSVGVYASTGGRYDWESVTRLLHAVKPMRYREAGPVAAIAGRVIQAAIDMPVRQGAAVDVWNVIAPGTGEALKAGKIGLASMREVAANLARHAQAIARDYREKAGLPYPAADDLRKWATRAFIEYNAEATTQQEAERTLAFWANVGESLEEVLTGLAGAAGAAAAKAAALAGKTMWELVKPLLPWVLGGLGGLVVLWLVVAHIGPAVLARAARR